MAVIVTPGKISYSVVWNIGKIKPKASNVFYMESSKWCFVFENYICPPQNEEDWKMYLKKIHPDDGNHAFLISVYVEDRFKKLECLGFTRLQVQKSGIEQIMWRRKSNLLLMNPYLKLDGDVNFVITILSDHPHITDIKSITDSTQTPSYMEIQPCLKSLSMDFRKLMEKGSGTDLEIRCGDNTSHVHKAVLIARSEVFAAMLQSDMLEKGSSFVKIVDMEYSILDIFLRYLYTGILPDMDVDMCRELYEAADKYGVDALKTRCALILQKNLTVENACNMLVLADSRCDDDLKQYVTSYMIQKDILMYTEEGQSFCYLYPNLAVEVLYKAYKNMKLTLTK